MPNMKTAKEILTQKAKEFPTLADAAKYFCMSRRTLGMYLAGEKIPARIQLLLYLANTSWERYDIFRKLLDGVEDGRT